MGKEKQVELVLAAKDTTRKSFDSVNKRMTKLEKNAKRIKKIGGIFTGIVAGATAGTLAMNALSDSLVESLGKLDDIGKASRRLGLTTDELQDLRVAAEASGVEISAFDTAFQRFARRVGQARLGTGELVKTFDLLDISLKDNKGNLKSNAALFQEFGSKIGAVSDENVQLALTMSGVDTEGVKLIDMFRTSAEDQQKVIDKARELGATYDTSLIKKAEAYKTEIDLVRKAQDVLSTQSELGMSQIILDWEELKLGIIETRNELLDFIGLQGALHDNTTKNLTKTNKLLDQSIKKFKEQLKLETDPARIKFLEQNLKIAESEKAIVEDQIRAKIKYYELIQDMEAKRGKKVKTITSKQLDEIGNESKSSKSKVDELKKSVDDLVNVGYSDDKQDSSSGIANFDRDIKKAEELKVKIDGIGKAKKQWLSSASGDSSPSQSENQNIDGLSSLSGSSKQDNFDYEKFKTLFGRGDGSKESGGVEINIKPNLDMKDMLDQAGATQKEIQVFYDRHPIKVKFDKSAANNVGSANIKPDSKSFGFTQSSIARQALKEGTKQ